MDSDFDIAIIGAGIAGASLGYFLESGARVLLLEAESAPGYHTTGRSAAFWVATYGGRFIEPLTSASKPFFDVPPPGFGDAPLLGPRGGLHLAPPEDADDRDHEAATALEDLEAEFAGSGLRFDSQVLDGQAAIAGHGAAVLSPFMFREALASGQLVQLFPQFAAELREFWVVVPEHKRRLAKVRAFREWLEAEVRAYVGDDPLGMLVPR